MLSIEIPLMTLGVSRWQCIYTNVYGWAIRSQKCYKYWHRKTYKTCVCACVNHKKYLCRTCSYDTAVLHSVMRLTHTSTRMFWHTNGIHVNVNGCCMFVASGYVRILKNKLYVYIYALHVCNASWCPVTCKKHHNHCMAVNDCCEYMNVAIPHNIFRCWTNSP